MVVDVSATPLLPNEGTAPDSHVPWLYLTPVGTHSVPAQDLRRLSARFAPGTKVAVACNAPFSSVRLRRAARRAGVSVDRELIVLPSLSSPWVIVDDLEAPVQHFLRSIATVPPGLTFSMIPATLALAVARAVPWRWLGLVAPGRVLIGTKR